MFENNTDRMFWIIAVLILGATLLMIGNKAFPKAQESIMSTISQNVKTGNKTAENLETSVTSKQYNTIYVRYVYNNKYLPDKKAVVNSSMQSELKNHKNVTQDDLDTNNYAFGKKLREVMLDAPKGYSTNIFSTSYYLPTPDGYKPTGTLFTKLVNNDKEKTISLDGNKTAIPYNSEISVRVNKN